MEKLMSPGSPFRDAFEHFQKYGKRKIGCSICAHMYVVNRKSRNDKPNPSYVDSKRIHVIDHTFTALYIKILRRDMLEEKLSNCLCYGSALYHTERSLNKDDHLDTQRNLLHESLDILEQKKLDTGDLKEVIIYIKINNSPERAVTYKKGERKVKHPHVWIMRSLPDYGGLYHTDHPERDECQREFMNNQLIFADHLQGLDLKKKVYLKFYINVEKTPRVTRCEIDIES